MFYRIYPKYLDTSSQLLNILVLNFEQDLMLCLKIEISCDVSSESTLFAQACLSKYIR